MLLAPFVAALAQALTPAAVPTGCAVEAAFVDADGRPVRGVAVQLVRGAPPREAARALLGEPTWELPSGAPCVARTDSSGVARLTHTERTLEFADRLDAAAFDALEARVVLDWCGPDWVAVPVTHADWERGEVAGATPPCGYIEVAVEPALQELEIALAGGAPALLAGQDLARRTSGGVVRLAAPLGVAFDVTLRDTRVLEPWTRRVTGPKEPGEVVPVLGLDLGALTPVTLRFAPEALADTRHILAVPSTTTLPFAGPFAEHGAVFDVDAARERGELGEETPWVDWTIHVARDRLADPGFSMHLFDPGGDRQAFVACGPSALRSPEQPVQVAWQRLWGSSCPLSEVGALLPTEVVVAGVVVDAAGIPLVGAEVEVAEDCASSPTERWRSLTTPPSGPNGVGLASGSPGLGRSTLRTDAHGRFELCARTESLRLRLDADLRFGGGHLRTATTTDVPRGARDVRLVVSATPTVTVDVLLPPGVPAADIGVVLRPAAEEGQAGVVARDVVFQRRDVARFVAAGVPAGSATLAAYDRRAVHLGPGGVLLGETGVEVAAGVVEQSPATFDLREAVAWIGPLRVRDEDGLALAGATYGVVHRDQRAFAVEGPVRPASERTWHAAAARELLVGAPGYEVTRVPLDATEVTLVRCAVVEVKVEVAPELRGRIDGITVALERGHVGLPLVATLTHPVPRALAVGEVCPLAVPCRGRWYVDVQFDLDGVRRWLPGPFSLGGEYGQRAFDVDREDDLIRHVESISEAAVQPQPYAFPQHEGLGVAPSAHADALHLRLWDGDGGALARQALHVALFESDAPPPLTESPTHSGAWHALATDVLGRTAQGIPLPRARTSPWFARVVSVAPDGTARFGQVAIPLDTSARVDMTLDGLVPPLRGRATDELGALGVGTGIQVEAFSAHAAVTLPHPLSRAQVREDGTFLVPGFPGVATYELTFDSREHFVDRPWRAGPGEVLEVTARRRAAR